METPEQQIRRGVVEQMDRCSVCHRSFHEEDVEVLSRRNDVWMMLVQCEDCQARSFVAALVGNRSNLTDIESQLFSFSSEGITLADPESELEHLEPAREGDPVDADDLLQMHDFLETFDGDFRSLFSK